MVKVAALVGDLAMPRGHRLARCLSVVRAPLLASQPPLGGREARRRRTGPTGILYLDAVGRGYKTGDPDVETNLPVGRGHWVCGYVVTGQDQHPMSSLAADLDRLDPPQHFPVRADLDLADPLQVHPRGLGVPAGAVTVFGPHHTVKPIRTLESRIPRCRTGSHSAKIPIEGPVQSAKGGLLAGERPHRRVGALTPNVLELRRLTCVGDTGPAVPPGIPALLQRRVVQLPMRLEACLQRDVLTRSRSQPKFVGAPHPNAPQRCSTPWAPAPSSRQRHEESESQP